MKRLSHKFWPPGIRLQVVCWYTAVFTLVLLLAGAAFYHYVENALENSVDTSLQIQAHQIATEIVAGHDTLTIHDATGALSGLSGSQPVDGSFTVQQDTFMRLLNAQGQVVRETPDSRMLRIPPQSIIQPLQGHPWQGTIRTTAGQEVQFYSQAFTVQGEPILVLQVGQSLEALHTLLHQLVVLLLIVGTLALLVCAISSFVLTRRAFTPVQHLMQTARRIKAGDLRQRVPVPAAQDEIRALAVTLNDMLDTLDQTMTRQRRFVADASHELRTPVAVIRNKTSIALLQPQKRQEYIAVLHEINAEAERLGHLISDLLALARGDEGHAPFEREAVRLDVLVEATAASLQPLAEGRAVQLTAHAEQPVTLIGDEARLIQVVMNLLENALRYTDAGGQVSLTVQPGLDQVQVIVQDTGIGIEPEHLPHLFERFYQVDPARNSTERGSHGLGLSIVAWIVQVHGGTIAVTSQPGQGSCFTVTLPLIPLAPTNEPR